MGGAISKRFGGIIGVARLVDRIAFGPPPSIRGTQEEAVELVRGHELFRELQPEHLNPLDWWAENLTGLRFDQAVRFAEIIPCRGKLGLFELPEEVGEAVRERRG